MVAVPTCGKNPIVLQNREGLRPPPNNHLTYHSVLSVIAEVGIKIKTARIELRASVVLLV
jgi:hypothetical protein